MIKRRESEKTTVHVGVTGERSDMWLIAHRGESELSVHLNAPGLQVSTFLTPELAREWAQVLNEAADMAEGV